MKFLKTKEIGAIVGHELFSNFEIGMLPGEPYETESMCKTGVIPIPRTLEIYEIRITPGRITLLDKNAASRGVVEMIVENRLQERNKK